MSPTKGLNPNTHAYMTIFQNIYIYVQTRLNNRYPNQEKIF